MILPLAIMYTPLPAVPFPDEFQGAWDENTYACSRAVTPSRLAISESHFLQRQFQGYSTSVKHLNSKVIVVDMIGGRSQKVKPSIQRLELSEDGDTLFVQSYSKTERTGDVTARIFVRCPDQEKALEGLL